jgi:DnaJ domain
MHGECWCAVAVCRQGVGKRRRIVRNPAGRRVDRVQDPFAVLGIAPDASLDEVRAARRRLAKDLHPDVGGDAARMQEVNRAFDLAVKAVLGRSAAGPRPGTATPEPAPPARSATVRRPVVRRFEHDAPSFTVDVLPVDAFEALFVVAGWMGQVLDDDPPYQLDVHLYEPWDCWCRLELAPEAGGTQVAVTVAGYDGREPPPVEAVRDLWVTGCNALGAPDPSP